MIFPHLPSEDTVLILLLAISLTDPKRFSQIVDRIVLWNESHQFTLDVNVRNNL